MIVLSRIDSRLIHGQVIEAWLPHLRLGRVVVADDVAAMDPLSQAAYAMAMPADVELVLASVSRADFSGFARDGVRTLVLFRDVPAAVLGRERGLPDGVLNVGNVHAGPGREGISRSVFLDAADTQSLRHLAHTGMEVQLQAVPSETPQPLP